jgi:hypothetical protein
MGGACVPRIATDGYRVSLLSPSHEARYVTGEFICTDGGLTRAVR